MSLKSFTSSPKFQGATLIALTAVGIKGCNEYLKADREKKEARVHTACLIAANRLSESELQTYMRKTICKSLEPQQPALSDNRTLQLTHHTCITPTMMYPIHVFADSVREIDPLPYENGKVWRVRNSLDALGVNIDQHNACYCPGPARWQFAPSVTYIFANRPTCVTSNTSSNPSQ